MLETIKSLMLASLGAAVLTKEKAMQFMDQAVQRGEMSAAEAEKLADEVAAESKRHAQEWGDKLQGAVDNALASLDLVKRSEVEELEARLAKVELELDALKRQAGQGEEN
ncbi:MAG: hypothetical protein K9K66_02260 [Desulfarculaceae bacterium]|nr:hypothetical protein [Desulfarculaceae bacterium]MCF8070871.1 hypothetical protein [Desulfarculaceae bacterium]MCF8100459.1 hypothetical protein [Desulfarculaceae bacterium]MCF8117955.1 hypothetical protein [Desulfarculaceae bacterium]